MPARKPTQLKVLQGTARKSRLTNEPKPKPAAPKCPDWLSKEAKRKWKELAPKLEKLGLLTELDGEQLAALCTHWSIIQQAAKDIKERGILIPSAREDGALVKNPALQVLRDNSMAFSKYAGHFGLDPVSRGRINLSDEKEKDDFEEFLNRGKKKT